MDLKRSCNSNSSIDPPLETKRLKIKDDKSADNLVIPFGNGEWLPVIPEPEENIYWNGFPWRFKRPVKPTYESRFAVHQPFAVWKLVAGGTVTHLPEACINHVTPPLSSKFILQPRLAPQVIDFGQEYEGVLGYFTERMLGINDYIPSEKHGLLNKLFDETGYKRNFEIIDRFGTVVVDKFPV